MTVAPAPGPVNWRSMSAALALGLTLLLIVLNAAIQPNFFAPFTLASNLTAFLPLMLIAVGQCYVVLGGSIDLSLGAVVSLVNVVVVQLVTLWGGGTGAILGAMVAGLGVGIACGAFNGVLIGTVRLQAIVTTFATSVIYGGLALKVMAQAGGALPAPYYLTYGGTVLGVPFVGWCLLALLAGVALVARTRFQAHLIAVGGNRQAAFQTGLGVARLRILSHAAAGGMAGLTALAILGVAGAGDPLMGQAFTLGSVSAIVLGGVSLAGGWGGAFGAILGATILGLINNLIFFANINYVYQSVVQGTIILLALAGGVFLSRRPQ